MSSLSLSVCVCVCVRARARACIRGSSWLVLPQQRFLCRHHRPAIPSYGSRLVPEELDNGLRQCTRRPRRNAMPDIGYVGFTCNWQHSSNKGATGSEESSDGRPPAGTHPAAIITLFIIKSIIYRYCEFVARFRLPCRIGL